MTLKERTEQALATLAAGGTSDSVAEVLRSQGITGRRRMSSSCPVSRYLQRELGLGVWLAVGSSTIYVKHSDTPGADMTLPPAIRDFIKRFDHAGEFEHLRGY